MLTWKVYVCVVEDACALFFFLHTHTLARANPGGIQEYCTAGEDNEFNSGAVLKFIDVDGTGFQLSAHTPSILVDVE